MSKKKNYAIIKMLCHYEDGRTQSYEGGDTCLGSGLSCNGRDTLTLGDVLDAEWVKTDHSFGSGKSWHIDGLGAYDNYCHNTLVISSSYQMDKFNSRYVEYELDISAGMHGEDGLLKTYPPRTKLDAVKKDALRIVREAYETGKWCFFTRNACGARACDNCYVKEEACA